MKHSALYSAAALVALGIGTATAAELPGLDDTYVGADLGFSSVDSDAGSADLMDAKARAGAFVYEDVLALEGRVGLGLDDDRLDVGADVEINHLYGVYALAHYSVLDQASVYGLVGYSELEAGVNDTDASYSGLSYGAGATLDVLDNIEAYAEYTRYLDDRDVTIDALSLGAKYNF